MTVQDIDFKWQDRGGFILMYAESEEAEVYAEEVLCDDEHDMDAWSQGIPFDRDEGMELIGTLEQSNFVVNEEV